MPLFRACKHVGMALTGQVASVGARLAQVGDFSTGQGAAGHMSSEKAMFPSPLFYTYGRGE